MKVIFHAIFNLDTRYYADECLNRTPNKINQHNKRTHHLTIKHKMFWSIHMFYSYCLLNTEQKVFLFYIFRELVSQYDILHNWLAFCLSYSSKLCRLNNCWTKIMINNCTNWFMLQNTENKINSDVSIYHSKILLNDKKWNNY